MKPGNYRSQDLQWKGQKLYLGSKLMPVKLVQSSVWPLMWRVQHPNGTLSDMVNLTRAKDAAISVTLAILNKPALHVKQN